MTSKERQILKEAVRKTILSHIDKPIKLKELVTENFQNWEIGRVMTLKDNPPFKTPKQIKEEKLVEGIGVNKVLDMANNNSFGKLGGKTVDAMSANLFRTVYDKADDKVKDKPLQKRIITAKKVIKNVIGNMIDSRIKHLPKEHIDYGIENYKEIGE